MDGGWNGNVFDNVEGQLNQFHNVVSCLRPSSLQESWSLFLARGKPKQNLSNVHACELQQKPKAQADSTECLPLLQSVSKVREGLNAAGLKTHDVYFDVHFVPSSGWFGVPRLQGDFTLPTLIYSVYV